MTDGTVDGTSTHETIATDGDDETMMTSEAGIDEIHETGTATGDVQEAGTATTDGTSTNDETGISTITVDGTQAIAEFGTENGNELYETITTDGDEAIVIISEAGIY